MLVFTALASEYFYRLFKDRPIQRGIATNRDSAATVIVPARQWDRQLQLMLVGLIVSTGFLLIR